jgi:multiple sugar transport system permease protein
VAGALADLTKRPALAGRRRWRLGRLLLPYAFVAPAVVTLLVVVAFPIARVIEISFFRGYHTTPRPEFVALANYTDMLGSAAFRNALGNSLTFTSGCVALQLSVGLALALLLNRRFNTRLRALFRGIFLLPWLFVNVVVAAIWALILHPGGAINSTLLSLGLFKGTPIDWLADFSLAMPSLIVANTWVGYPFSMVMFLAALQSIPSDLYEAASVDGAGAWHRFRLITLPGIAPSIVTIALLDTIWTFRQWDLPFLLTGGGPIDATVVLPLLTYRLGFEGLRFGQSAAVAVIILVITLVFSFFYLRYRARLLE